MPGLGDSNPAPAPPTLHQHWKPVEYQRQYVAGCVNWAIRGLILDARACASHFKTASYRTPPPWGGATK